MFTSYRFMWLSLAHLVFNLTVKCQQNTGISTLFGGIRNNLSNSTKAHFYPEIFIPFGSLHSLEILEFWAAKEEYIYKIMRHRRYAIQKEIDLITRYITDYEQTSGKALIKANKPIDTLKDRGRLIGASSVLSHRMTDRFANLVNDLQKLLGFEKFQNVSEGLRNELELKKNNYQMKWPVYQDLFISNVAILELQNFYNLATDMIFTGPNYETDYGGVLNSSHCALFGIIALKYKHHFRSVEWLEFTLEYIINQANHTDQSVLADFVQSLLCVSIQQHNGIYQFERHAEGKTIQNSLQLFGEPAVFGEDLSSRWYLNSYLFENLGQKYGNLTFINEYINMFLLCHGEYDFQPIEIKSRLRCYLDRKRHPYFILNPVKTEQLSEYPYIVQFYDVLGNDSIEEFYRARGEVRVSTILESTNVEDTLNIRSSAGALTHPDYVYKIQNKSEVLTGLLLTDMMEGIQTVEYVYGRLYKTHSDPMTAPGSPVNESLDRSVMEGGDRVATLLYYVDVPVDGGNTVFSSVGIVAEPVSGSAVFWLNMHRNGTVRGDVQHSSCPVIHGYKTIINQWIRYNSNFQTFKCSLNQFD